MPELDDLLGAIDLYSPFAEQPDVQSFLGKPAISDNTTVPSQLLYRFLQLAEQVLGQEKFNFVGRSYITLKLGYERKVAIDPNGKLYRLESHFVAHQDWRYEYDQAIRARELARFLDAPSDKMTNEDETRQASPNLIPLNEAIAEELYRLYPQLKNCIEVHVYLLAQINIFPNDNTEIMRRDDDLNLDGNSFADPRIFFLASTDCPGCTKSNGEVLEKGYGRYKTVGGSSVCTAC